MSDGRSPFNVTLGTGLHTRNAPALVNSSFYEWTNWGGRFAAQWELPLAVAENAVTMNSTRLQLAHYIYDNYKAPYEALFGALPAALAPSAADAARFPATGKPGQAAWDTTMTSAEDKAAVNSIIVNYGKAIQAYLRKLVSRNAPFDQYVESGGGNLSASAIRGSLLFVGKAKCTACHSGPFFSDNKFHNLRQRGRRRRALQRRAHAQGQRAQHRRRVQRQDRHRALGCADQSDDGCNHARGVSHLELARGQGYRAVHARRATHDARSGGQLLQRGRWRAGDRQHEGPAADAAIR